jgi:hypothetical protein
MHLTRSSIYYNNSTFRTCCRVINPIRFTRGCMRGFMYRMIPHSTCICRIILAAWILLKPSSRLSYSSQSAIIRFTTHSYKHPMSYPRASAFSRSEKEELIFLVVSSDTVLFMTCRGVLLWNDAML